MAAVADTNPPEGGFVDGKENDDANGKTTQTLAEMFEQGQGEIGTARNCNLFQELQGRNLTDKEQEIVQARTAHMKKMYEEYERREKKRKVEELMGVCPDMTEKEVEVALEFYDGNEEETAMALVSDENIKARVKAMAGGTYLPPSRRAKTGDSKTPLQKYNEARGGGSGWKVPSADAKGGIFIGGFRGKGLPASKSGPRAARPAAVPKAEPPAPAKPEPEAAAAAAPKKQKKLASIRLHNSPAESPCENTKIDDLVVRAGEKKQRQSPRASPKAKGKVKGAEGEAAVGWRLRILWEADSTYYAAKVKSYDRASKLHVVAYDSGEEEKLDLAKVTAEWVGRAEEKAPGGATSEATRSLRTTSAAHRSPRGEPASVKSAEKAKRPAAGPSKGRELKLDDDAAAPVAEGSAPRPSRALSGSKAGKRKKPSLGRVRQKSTKRGEVVEVGTVRSEKGWHNQGYIFPEGFLARTPFRSSVELDQLVAHECSIIGEGGKFWPAPTFSIVAPDRLDEPLYGKSATACWTQILKRINAEIERRRREGEDLPPPPKTAIAGPEYFGLNQEQVMRQIEAQDPERRLEHYWAGKEDREEYMLQGFVQESRTEKVAKRKGPARSGGGGSSRRGKKRKGRSEWSESEDEDGDIEEGYGRNRWNSVNRSERYKTRCKDRGDKNVDEEANEDNPLPGFTDPITLEPVVNPGISPYGHVMGMATWRAVLDEQGKCPFTKQELSMMKIKKLTKTNIEQYRAQIIAL